MLDWRLASAGRPPVAVAVVAVVVEFVVVVFEVEFAVAQAVLAAMIDRADFDWELAEVEGSWLAVMIQLAWKLALVLAVSKVSHSKRRPRILRVCRPFLAAVAESSSHSNLVALFDPPCFA